MKVEFTKPVVRVRLCSDEYPYRVEYRRTQNWFTNDWREISSWCNSAFGKMQWEYFDQQFCFRNEQNLLWFILRWA